MSVLFAARFGIDYFAKLTIVASNDINEDTIHSLNQQVRAHAACTRQSMLFSASLLIWKLYYSVLNILVHHRHTLVVLWSVYKAAVTCDQVICLECVTVTVRGKARLLVFLARSQSRRSRK